MLKRIKRPFRILRPFRIFKLFKPLDMYQNKKFKLIWTIITIIGIFAMLFFTILPAFYGGAF